MKTLFITTGTAGDVLPFIEAARTSEHAKEAIVVANEAYRDRVRNYNLGFLPHSSAREYKTALTDQRLWDTDLNVAMRAAIEIFSDPTAAKLKEIFNTFSNIDSGCQIVAHPLCRPAFDSKFPTIGAVVSPAMLETEFVDDMHGIGLWPDWFHPGIERFPPTMFRILIEQSTDIHLTRWLQGKRPVIVTFGQSGHTKRGVEAYNDTIAACNSLGIPALVIGANPRLTQRHPRNYYTDFVPLWYPLKYASAIVHHGGVGTCAMAFFTNTKQIICPFGLDQFDNAARCEQLGHRVAMSSKLIHFHLERSIA